MQSIRDLFTQTKEQILALDTNEYLASIDDYIRLGVDQMHLAYEDGRDGVFRITDEMRNDEFWSGLTEKVGSRTTVTVDEMRAYVMEVRGVAIDQTHRLVALADDATKGELRTRATEWIDHHFGEPVSLMEFMASESNVTPEMLERMSRENPIYNKVLEGLQGNPVLNISSRLNNSTETLAYVIADNAAKSTNVTNLFSYAIDAYNKDREQGTTMWGGFLKLIYTALSFLPGSIGEYFQQKDSYRESAMALGLTDVAQGTAESLIKDYNMREADAYEVAQLIYRNGLESQGYTVTDTPFDDKIHEAVDANFPAYHTGFFATFFGSHKQHGAVSDRMDTLRTEHAQRQQEERAASQSQETQEQEEKSWWQQGKEFVTGNNEFNYPELLEADLSKLGMEDTSTKTAFRGAVGLSWSDEGIATAVKNYFPDVELDDFHADKNGNVFVTIQDQNFYLNKSGVSMQDTSRLAAEGAMFIPFFGWSARIARGAQLGVAGARALQLSNVFRGLSALAASDFMVDRLANVWGGGEPLSAERMGENVINAFGYLEMAGAGLGTQFIGKISEKIINGTPLTALERVRAKLGGIDLDKLTEDLAMMTRRKMVEMYAAQGQAVPASLAGAAVVGGSTVDAAAGEPVPSADVPDGETVRPGKTPAQDVPLEQRDLFSIIGGP